MKTKLVATAVLLFTYNLLFAQNVHFMKSGTIQFEKTANTYALIKKMYGKEMDDEAYLQQLFDQYKKTQSQFKVLKSTLTFSDNKTLFSPVKSDEASNNFFLMPLAEQNNVIYSDLNTKTNTGQKTVFDQPFLVKDSLRKIKWKITDENREIAGYNCRRANGLMMDSIYVVAFYTNQIPVSGGPESFSGLPGMILEVALPHENVIWRATKVTEEEVPENVIAAPKKGKLVDNKQLLQTLQSQLKGRGDATMIDLILKWYML